MPTSKKPRKKYTPRHVIRPFNVRDPWSIEGDAHACLMAMDAGVLTHEHISGIVAHVSMIRRVAREQHVQVQCNTVLRMCLAIQQRYQTSGQVTITASEEAAIRAGLAVVMEASRGARSSDILNASLACLRELDKIGGVAL